MGDGVNGKSFGCVTMRRHVAAVADPGPEAKNKQGDPWAALLDRIIRIGQRLRM